MSAAAVTELSLDHAVRDWVFIPLTTAIVLMKLLTQYAHSMFNSPSPQGAAKEPAELREFHSVGRSQRLRGMLRFIPESSFRARRDYLAAKDTGLFWQKVQSKSLQEAMATDPSVMMDMMKKNLTGMVPQLAMGFVVNFFFQGFVVGKIPFALSPRFKPMLQRGIDLQSLDVSYFTSLSFYILLLFGLRGAFSLFFREDTVDEGELMRRQMNPGAAMGFDANAAFTTERTALATLDHEWEMETAEEKAIEVMRANVAKKHPSSS